MTEKMDLLISDIEGQSLLLRNLSPAPRHWLTVRLEGGPVIEGAVVTVRAGTQKWMRRSTDQAGAISPPAIHASILAWARSARSMRCKCAGRQARPPRSGNVPVDRELVVEG